MRMTKIRHQQALITLFSLRSNDKNPFMFTPNIIFRKQNIPQFYCVLLTHLSHNPGITKPQTVNIFFLFNLFEIYAKSTNVYAVINLVYNFMSWCASRSLKIY